MKRIIFVTICFLALLGCSSDGNSEPPIVETKFLMGLIGEKFRVYYDDPNGYKVRNENSDVISASFGGDHWLNIILKKEGNTNITVKDVDMLNECINYCIKNNINTLCVNSIDRIGRNTLNVLSTLEKLHENKINVYIQQLGLNTLNEDKTVNPCTAILTTVMAQMASIERENIKYRL